jgi:hypothetical protein
MQQRSFAVPCAVLSQCCAEPVLSHAAASTMLDVKLNRLAW